MDRVYAHWWQIHHPRRKRVIPHGTPYGYRHCRPSCAACKEAWRNYMREYRWRQIVREEMFVEAIRVAGLEEVPKEVELVLEPESPAGDDE
jgi:putative cell wall-binding protein